MPTFTTVALDTLLEPQTRESFKNHFESKELSCGPLNGGGEDRKRKAIRTPKHIYIKPALYATPEVTPIPDTSAESLSPSPYVVNHKRRGGKAVSCSRRIDGFEVLEEKGEPEGEEGGGRVFESAEVMKDNFMGAEVNGDGSVCLEMEDDGIVDAQCDSQSIVSTQAEFFDVGEDFSSDGSVSSVSGFGRNFESELHATRLSLLTEIAGRKSAEDALNLMHNQWQEIHNSLVEAGLTFPGPPNNECNFQPGTNSVEQFIQEVIVSRFVAEAIGKGLARAESELAAEAILELKDQEISRLRDRLQYYETVNHEMSQRNLEIIGTARRQRQRKKSQRRWLWCGVGLALATGASVIAYSYFWQMGGHHPSPSSSSSSNDSCISSPESS